MVPVAFGLSVVGALLVFPLAVVSAFMVAHIGDQMRAQPGRWRSPDPMLRIARVLSVIGMVMLGLLALGVAAGFMVINAG